MQVKFTEKSRLPALSETVNSVIMLFNKGNVDIKKLEAILVKDPGLSSQVLKIANSPFFGFSGKISSIKEACMIVGLSSIYNLVTAIGVMDQFQSSTGKLNFKKFWQHAFAKGVATQIIAETCNIDEPSAFITGLLRDVGKIMLDTYFPDTHEEISRFQEEHNCAYEKSHLKILDKSDVQISAHILSYWRLPQVVITAIEQQGDMEKIAESDLACALHLADFMVKGLGIGNNGGNYIVNFSVPALNAMGLDYLKIEEILGSVDETVSENQFI